MNFICEEIIEHAKGVVIAREPQDLIAIREHNCAATLWKRKFQSDFQTWIDQLPPENLPEGRLILPQNRIADAVHQLCEIAGTPEGSTCDMLVNDIDALAQLFSALMGTEYLRLRLEKVTDNACRKFHKDAITARLVCTYRGQGTQYGTSLEGDEPQQIFNVPTGAPILLRGTLWPETPESGLLHRSPPIEGTGETRLLLVLDPVSDPENDV
ncbi:DUF1826 domain-containing protein [Lentilitoribacter sp. EG35]|uniref:DUF1826 domain-containing protein n=1 Tax=Lentilitoribacter sp. EG35 TaxID=3234192 RepID=UPI00346114F9